jgi:hypothetical protein
VISLDRNAAGELNFARLAQTPTTAEPKKTAEAESKPAEAKSDDAKSAPFLATVKTLLVKNGRLAFRDAVPEGGFQRDINGLDLTVRDFSTAPESRAVYDLSLQTDREERLKVGGSLVLEPLTVESAVDLSGLGLEGYTPYLKPFLNYPVSGGGAVKAALAFREGVIRVTDGQLALQELHVPFGGNEGLKLGRLTCRRLQLRRR